MNNNWIIKIGQDLGYKTARDIYIFRRSNYGKRQFVGKDGLIHEVSEGEEIKEKHVALSLEPEQLQALADELSKTGYKPEKGFVNGKLEATEKHLEDMRKLVFKTNEQH